MHTNIPDIDPSENDKKVLAQKLIEAQKKFNKKLKLSHNYTRVVSEYRAHLAWIFRLHGLDDLKFGVLINSKHQLAIYTENVMSYWVIVGIKSIIDQMEIKIIINLQFDDQDEA